MTTVQKPFIADERSASTTAAAGARSQGTVNCGVPSDLMTVHHELTHFLSLKELTYLY